MRPELEQIHQAPALSFVFAPFGVVHVAGSPNRFYQCRPGNSVQSWRMVRALSQRD